MATYNPFNSEALDTCKALCASLLDLAALQTDPALLNLATQLTNTLPFIYIPDPRPFHLKDLVDSDYNAVVLIHNKEHYSRTVINKDGKKITTINYNDALTDNRYKFKGQKVKTEFDALLQSFASKSFKKKILILQKVKNRITKVFQVTKVRSFLPRLREHPPKIIFKVRELHINKSLLFKKYIKFALRKNTGINPANIVHHELSDSLI